MGTSVHLILLVQQSIQQHLRQLVTEPQLLMLQVKSLQTQPVMIIQLLHNLTGHMIVLPQQLLSTAQPLVLRMVLLRTILLSLWFLFYHRHLQTLPQVILQLVTEKLVHLALLVLQFIQRLLHHLAMEPQLLM